MELTNSDARRIREIEARLARVDSSPWRNTIRRESPDEVARLIRTAGGLGVPLCSEVVVNTEQTPRSENVICWMGPAAGSHGDDLDEASFIANSKSDIEWLLAIVNEGSAGPRTAG